MSPGSAPPRHFSLEKPGQFLNWLAEAHHFDVRQVSIPEVWGLGAIAALARSGTGKSIEAIDAVDAQGSESLNFAHAVGFFSVLRDEGPRPAREPSRTVPLRRLHKLEDIESVANEISGLLFPSPSSQGSRRTVLYVLRELLRNVVQHSNDPLGAVVGAQRNDRGASVSHPTVQLVVADCGLGIPATLVPRHPTLTDPREALEKSLWPHISSAFDAGGTGGVYNAGLGLFFVSEFAKLVGGRLLLASRGAALTITTDPAFEHPARQAFLPRGQEFAGTLVAFEMPSDGEQLYDEMIETITARARERRPQRNTEQWFRFETAPSGARRFLVSVAAENTLDAGEFAKNVLRPALDQRIPLVLDLKNVSSCTQSFAHALLYEPVRIAWALKVPIYVENAQPAVRSTLEYLQSYALVG